jgi:tetratricopeptide (TPR) repeat protein
MDLLFVAREAGAVAATSPEVTDPADARALLARLPHGQQVAPLVARLSIGALVLAKQLDRGAARAAIGVAMQRSQPRGVVLLGHELGRELLGEGLPLAGGIRVLHNRPIGALGQAKGPEIERILAELCARAGVSWSPPGTRAAPARAVVRAEEAEVQATRLIEQQQWQQAVDTLRAAEPLAPRGLNMLGRALLQLGDRAGARRAFERTLAIDPSNPIAQRQLAGLAEP